MATFTAAKAGNWTAADTWDLNSSYPQASDNAVVTGYTVTMDDAVAVTNLTIGASGILTTANFAITISGNWNQSSTSSRCNAGTSTITINGNGTFTADGTLDSTQYNSATLVLNGTNTITYSNLSYVDNGFGNLTCGQSGNTTTTASHMSIMSVLTVGSGTFTGSSWIYFKGANPFVFDANSINSSLDKFVKSKLSIFWCKSLST